MHGLLRKCSLVFTFYRDFLVGAIFMSVACLVLFYEYGMPVFTVLFWLKLGSFLPIYLYVENNRKKEFYYYFNLGMSRLLLWSCSLGFDFLVFIISVILMHRYGKHPGG